jgi:hypothetical protein
LVGVKVERNLNMQAESKLIDLDLILPIPPGPGSVLAGVECRYPPFSFRYNML